MIKEEMFKIVQALPFDVKKITFDDTKTKIFLFRPSVLSNRFVNYDRQKNFQIWFIEGEREFRPNHLRLLIDLNLRIRCRNDLKRELLLAFDKIYYGEDPEIILAPFEQEKFDHFLNSITVIGNLAQLFHIEQEYGYNKKSNFSPPNLFLQGWIRQSIDNPKEIDNLCMSVCSGQPPAAKYTNKENPKNKNYQKKLPPLWYLTD
jgi:hypothetical protein